MAAVLALGDRASISHRSAAGLWRFLPPHNGAIEITVPGDGGRERRKGIRIHRSSTLIAAVSVLRDGIRVTKPQRTLRDLHRTSPRPIFQKAVRRALDLRLISNQDLRSETDLTSSELEREFLRLCRRHRFPSPESNARIGPYEVDFLWRDRRLIVETDGYRHRGDRASFEADRARDADIQRRGFRVLRFTYRHVREEPAAVARHLHAFLAQSALTPDL